LEKGVFADISSDVIAYDVGCWLIADVGVVKMIRFCVWTLLWASVIFMSFFFRFEWRFGCVCAGYS